MSTRDLDNIVAAAREFLSEREPNLLDRSTHDRRHREECAEHNRDLHFAGDDACKIDKSESTARSISKRRAKHRRAFARISSRLAGGVFSQRSINLIVPGRSSLST